MSTCSSDPSYIPTNESDDDFSADTADNLSVIYADQKHPPQALEAPFDIMDFEAALSQQAFLHFQELHDHVHTTMPQRQDEFTALLTHAVRTNQDPVGLRTLVNGWSPNHP
jgi:hypothetical protein